MAKANEYGKLPNKVYTYTAQPRFKYGTAIAYGGTPLLNDNDTGVFVWDNVAYPPESSGTVASAAINHAQGFRVTRVNTKSCIGVINMGLASMGYAIELMATNTGEWSSGGQLLSVEIGLLRNYTRPQSANRVVYLREDNDHDTGLYWNLDASGYYTNSVNKVEVCYETNAAPNLREIVYVTGFTFFSASGKTGGIRLPKPSTLTSTDDNNSTKNIIICRLVPFEEDYPFLTWNASHGSYYCYQPSIVFNGLTGQVYCVLYDSASEVTLASGISQAIPDAALCSNDGIIAVAMLAKTPKGAYWLGYKNGIYKLYQGATPLNGMPGEKITIKGHEFVCLAYGPFYARMS